MQDHTNTANTNEIIRTICQYIIRRAFKLFDNETRLASLQRMVGSLRLTSKSLNKSICDELSLEIMHRWMKGLERAALVTKRINQFLQKYMGLVVKIFSRRESIPLLSSFLITITQHHKHMVKYYITFFTSSNLHMTIDRYHSEPRNFPFPGFKPEHVERALQIANENGWSKESLFLLDHYIDYYVKSATTTEQAETTRTKLQTALQSGQKLNFTLNVANRISNACYKKSNWLYSRMVNWMWLYIREKKNSITTTDLSKVLHSVTINGARELLHAGKNIIKDLYHLRAPIMSDLVSDQLLCPTLTPFNLIDSNKSDTYVISFKGSQIIKYCCRRLPYDTKMLTFKMSPSTKDFTGLPATPETTRTVYMYYYYRAIVESKLELAKKIEAEHGIKLSTIQYHILEHPHPLDEYLNHTDAPKQDMVDYLVKKFNGVDTCLLLFNRPSVSDPLLAIIKKLVAKGAKHRSMAIWKALFYEKIPRNEKELMALVELTDNWETTLVDVVIPFLLNDFRKYCQRMLSDTQVLLLLAWKYGGKSCRLTILPKEILLMVMEFMDEQPLFIKLAEIIMKKVKDLTWVQPVPTEALESSGEIAKFVRRHCTKSTKPFSILQNYKSYKTIRRDLASLKGILSIRHARSNIAYQCPIKFITYMCKHETDENYLKMIVDLQKKFNSYLNIDVLEYGLAVKNTRLVHEFYKQRKLINEHPNEDKYNRIVLKKNKPSFAEAQQMAKDIRRHNL